VTGRPTAGEQRIGPNGRPDLDALLDALRPLVAAVVEPLEDRISELERQLDSARGRRWLTVDEAAEQLACSRAAVRMRVKRGRLEARRQGRRVYVSRDSVDRLA
jgi:excisionase family DNA binding protein